MRAPISPKHARETPDIESSTDAYARRFAGRAGQYLLDVQRDATLRLLEPWRGGTVLDVGGGHTQLAAPLADAGYRVTILASDSHACARPRRLLNNRVQLLVGDLIDPPLHAKSVDVAISFRIMPHVADWRRLVDGLCRVARWAVVVDFPTPGGFNALSALFTVKKWVEGNTRRYRTIEVDAVADAFAAHGFRNDATFAQFFLPMVLHRTLKAPPVSRLAEHWCRRVGATERWGSPRIMRARCDLPPYPDVAR